MTTISTHEDLGIVATHYCPNAGSVDLRKFSQELVGYIHV
jgi:hypothetical protein